MASVDLHILQEKENFTRLSWLLVDKGTEALRSTFDTIHSPANLSSVLAANRISLLRLKPRVINNSQWDLLYPQSGNPPDSKTFDVTLLTVLLRNICGLHVPSTGWNVMPPDTDRSLQANITRIMLFRNKVYAHVTSTKVDNATFQSLWQKISQALVELNVPQHDVDHLETSPLSPEEDKYVKMLEDWELQENELMKLLESLNNKVESIKVTVEENQAEIKQQSNMIEAFQSSIKRTLQVSEDTNLKKKFRKESDEDILRKLAKHNFKGKIKSKVKFFMPGTRKWLFEKVDDFVKNEHESRILLLTAGPGFGKSVFAAKVCEDYKKKGTLAALHFCDFNNSNLRDPMVMLQSLASQMCENVEGFKDKLLDQLKRPHQAQNLKDAFGVYLQNPLDELELKESGLVVIDGLDESAADNKNEIVDLIGDCFQDLPECIKILVTSRPEISLAKLSSVQTIDIKPNEVNNSSDLEIYFKACLPNIADKRAVTATEFRSIPLDYWGQRDNVYGMLSAKCEGSFLYAFYVQSELKKRDDLNTMTFLQISQFLPEGVGSIYHAYFKRFEDELKLIKHENVDVLKILEILAVSEGRPLPLIFLTRAIGLAPDSRETKNIINKVNETISCLLYVSNDLVTVFHKSVVDWLLAKGYKDHEYAVNVNDANKYLWLLCEQDFEEIKTTVVSEVDFNPESLSVDLKYALDHGFHHLAACKMEERFFWLADVIIIYALFTVHPQQSWKYILDVWDEILQGALVLSNELRVRISWHVIEIDFLERNRYSFHVNNLPYYYLHSVFTHSPRGCFSDEEKKIAKLLLPKTRQFVEFNFYDVEVMPLAFWRNSRTEKIIAVGISPKKTMAAIAFKNGRIIVLSVPSLVELWSYPTEYKRICCCVFAPDDSLVLFGKLDTALSIAGRKELPFLHGTDETFVSCAFSPNGNRLVTCDGSCTVKLWDVSGQSLLSLLDAKVPVNWCAFSGTGLFIIGDRKCNVEGLARQDSESDDKYSRIGNGFEYDEDGMPIINLERACDQKESFCIWNAITWLRSDERSLADELGQSQSRRCKCCFQPDFRDQKLEIEQCAMSPQKNWFFGVYEGERRLFVLYDHSLKVWGEFSFEPPRLCGNIYGFDQFMEVAAVVDDLLFCVDYKKFTVFKKFAAKQEQTLCLPRPVLVQWNSFSPDGSRLATCVSGGCIEIWNTKTSLVEQRFQSNHDDPLFACWWSEQFLFLFEFVHGVPSLSRYSVYNLKVLFSQNQRISLSHFVDDFESLSAIRDFSEGFLSFDCGDTKPVKVLDVNGGERPQMITLPKIRPMMNITVSPGASFIFGGGDKYFIWKRNASKEPNVYDLMEEEYYFEGVDEDFDVDLYEDFNENLDDIVFRHPFYQPKYTCCFSNDSQVAVVVNTEDLSSCEIIDLITGSCPWKYFYDSFLLKHVSLSFSSQLFCIKNNVLIVASAHEISFFHLDSGVLLASSFQRYLTWDLRKQIKVSPKENMIAFPKMNGDVVFVRLCIPSEPLLCNIKREAATRWENYLKKLLDEMNFKSFDDSSTPIRRKRIVVRNDWPYL